MILNKAQFEQVCDNIFEANNFLKEENAASKKVELVAGEPGTKERIEFYTQKVANGETLFE